MKIKIKKAIFLFIYFIFIAILIILFELVLRIFNYGLDTRVFLKVGNSEKYYTDNTLFVNKYYPGVEKKIISLNSNLFKVKKEKHTLRGFVLGGSTSQGYPYNVNHSFGKITEKLINSSSNDKRKIEIINVSHSSMSSYYISDIAKKLKYYKPDFLIIYSGHNEYYGTINSVRKNHFENKTYLFLKEFKIIQLLIKILNIEKSLDTENQTLMEKLYDQNYILNNDERNNYIIDCFKKNMQSVFNSYKNDRVKIIVIEPISNIIEMAPFKGEKDEELNKEIESYIDILKENKIEKIKEFVNSKISDNNNANLMYLKAIMLKKINNFNTLYNFKVAKDLDLVPFRAKSQLIDSLIELQKLNMSKNNINYLSLEKKYLSFTNEDIFSNIIFSDHLHFNFKGNLLCSYYLALELSRIFSLNLNYKILESNYDDSNFYYNNLYYSDISEILAYQNLNSLFGSYLYKNMKIKYVNNTIINKKNIYINDLKYYKYINDFGLKIYENLYNYYLAEKDYNKAEYILKSLDYIIPYNRFVGEKLINLYEMTGDFEKRIEIINKIKNIF